MKKTARRLAVIAFAGAALCLCACTERGAGTGIAAEASPQAPVVVTAAETAAPTETPRPTAEPTPVPTAEPTPTPVPTASPAPDYVPTDVPEADGLYKLVVYFGTQSVGVYRAEDGAWALERVMICSTGKRTPTGTYAVYTKYRYHALYGAYGQYCSRIDGPILFHSVPIDENARKVYDGQRRMKLDEYEKLGTTASDGCVRLTCADAMWIHDNCDRTTAVVLTEAAGPAPTAPPALIREAPYMTAAGYGWDPTDPDPENPYREVYGKNGGATENVMEPAAG